MLSGLAVILLTASTIQAAVVVNGSRIMDQDMEENLCALTFDDGPSPNTPILLDMLASYGIPATFFLLGRNVTAYPEILDRIIAEGHEVGNHSWSHPNLKRLSLAKQAEQITETDRLLRAHGATPFYMRPPYGSFDDNTVKIAQGLGLGIMLWSLDSKDWQRLPDDYGRLGSTRGTVYEPGELRGIFLFHDTHRTTVDDFPRIVADLRAGGCEKFVTVSEYLAGIADPEPGSLMTRRPTRYAANGTNRQLNEQTADRAWLQYPAGSGPVPLARSSRPWQNDRQTQIDLDEAHASADHAQNGMMN